MQEIIARGIWHGRDVEVVWRDGKMAGDAAVIDAMRVAAVQLEGFYIGHPLGGGETHDHLSWPGGFSYVAYELLDQPRFQQQGLPAAPELKRGEVR